MQINSLGTLTNLFFARWNGMVLTREHHWVVKTPSNPGFHWGNYLLFDRAPEAQDVTRWVELFDQEMDYGAAPHHYAFAWEGSHGSGELSDFIAQGFQHETSVVLLAKSLVKPRPVQLPFEVRALVTDEEWESATEVQIACGDPAYSRGYREFKVRQMKSYRLLAQAGHGAWFGGFVAGVMVADLGVFHQGGIGRYQNVGTLPEHRRRGYCGELVYQAGLYAQKNFQVETLVMEADPDYHAARIYESVGFQREPIVGHQLSRWPR
jgi:ribosomal protein S18 acetylase RimI-like enzyme